MCTKIVRKDIKNDIVLMYKVLKHCCFGIHYFCFTFNTNNLRFFRILLNGNDVSSR